MNTQSVCMLISLNVIKTEDSLNKCGYCGMCGMFQCFSDRIF